MLNRKEKEKELLPLPTVVSSSGESGSESEYEYEYEYESESESAESEGESVDGSPGFNPSFEGQMQWLCSEITFFRNRTRHLKNSEVCMMYMNSFADQLQKDRSDQARRAASEVATMLRHLSIDPQSQGQRSESVELNREHNITIVEGVATRIAEMGNKNGFMKSLLVALASVMFLVTGVTVTAGLVGGVMNLPTAVGALAYYAGKGLLSEKFLCLFAKLALPTVVIGGTGAALSWCTIFGAKRPMYDSFSLTKKSLDSVLLEDKTVCVPRQPTL